MKEKIMMLLLHRLFVHAKVRNRKRNRKKNRKKNRTERERRKKFKTTDRPNGLEFENEKRYPAAK